jgi:hypothetical protein
MDINFTPADFDISEEELLNWVSWSAKAVATYYGHFPVRRLNIFLRAGYGDSVGYGQTNGDEPPRIRVNVGRSVTRDELNDDWVMTHEMCHLGFPSVQGDHSWIEEGMATYIEPVARARIGNIKEDEVWGQMVRNMPRAIRISGNHGLEDASNFREIYWGGALFWLLADVEIHKRTNNRLGLENVFRKLIANDGIITNDWELAEVLKEVDKDAGLPIFHPLYRRMTTSPIEVNLDDLWNQLGIKLDGRKVIFDNNAPLASVRRAITKTGAVDSKHRG